jgi:hypothetical protein
MTCFRFALYVHEHRGVCRRYQAPLAGDATPPQTITRNGKTYELRLISTIDDDPAVPASPSTTIPQ